MATAFKITHDLMLTDHQHCTRLAKMLTAQLQQLEGVHFNGNQINKLPNIFNVSFDQVDADSLIIAL